MPGIAKVLMIVIPFMAMHAPMAQGAIDCSRATSNVDRLLCSSSRAAAAEERMAHAFRAAVSRGIPPGQLRNTQQQWKAEIRDRCNDVDCLTNAYDQRAIDLDGLGPQ